MADLMLEQVVLFKIDPADAVVRVNQPINGKLTQSMTTICQSRPPHSFIPKQPFVPAELESCKLPKNIKTSSSSNVCPIPRKLMIRQLVIMSPRTESR